MMSNKLLRWTLAFAGTCALAQFGCDSPPPRAEPPPPKVSVAKPQVREIADSDQYNGWLQPTETVEVRARVRGHLEKVHFVDDQLLLAFDRIGDV